MDKSRVQEDLERQVATQKEQLSRYEKRIHDVVTAYKGLIKEKEALEASLVAVSNNEASESSPSATSTATPTTEQLATMMNSLATLSAEKSRMEVAFQREKKVLRGEMQEKDKRIRELEDKTQQKVQKNSLEIEGLKSKLIVERHSREKETNDQLVMIKELQKLLSDERQLKENLEMQLNDLKVAFTGQGAQSQSRRYEDLLVEHAKLKEDHLEQLEKTQQNSNGKTGVTLEQLQELIANMKKQHQLALRSEQIRSSKAEEEIRNMSLFHEERVANLEARLAELSTTVGNYDRLRQQDQANIQKLKDKLLDATSSTPLTNKFDLPTGDYFSIEGILSEIDRLKQLLLKENATLKNPVDVSGIFSLSSDHVECVNKEKSLKSQLAEREAKSETLEAELKTEKQHICNLQEKITVLNRNIEEQEVELKQSNEKFIREMRETEEKWKQNLELAVRVKTEEMEQHLQKQRERSINLLEEKDNEIKALKTSFELFIPVETHSEQTPSSPQGVMDQGNPFASDGKTNILHYVHELARKDVEISSLRKSKHSAESAMRQAIKDKITSQEELHDQIATLEEQVGR